LSGCLPSRLSKALLVISLRPIYFCLHSFHIETAKVLGTIKKLRASTSKKFAVKISKYVDSGDKKRAGKRKRERKTAKTKAVETEMANSEKMEVEIVNENGNEKERENEGGGEDPEEPEPALWPLIRLVQIRCRSEALSKGAVLVDLPGVADANMARTSIANEYMKKCERIWITAPIQRYGRLRYICIGSHPIFLRALDDKSAKGRINT
jgi:hypothetical protein